jgi:hypothetical protein
MPPGGFCKSAMASATSRGPTGLRFGASRARGELAALHGPDDSNDAVGSGARKSGVVAAMSGAAGPGGQFDPCIEYPGWTAPAGLNSDENGGEALDAACIGAEVRPCEASLGGPKSQWTKAFEAWTRPRPTRRAQFRLCIFSYAIWRAIVKKRGVKNKDQVAGQLRPLIDRSPHRRPEFDIFSSEPAATSALSH